MTISSSPFPSVSVVVPVYNAERSLSELCKRLAAVLDGLGLDWEAVLVDDGSRDASWSVLCDLASSNERLRAVRLMRNHGQHNALLCAVRLAGKDVIVTLDDDLQHPPEEIPKLLAELAKGHDVVYGAFPEERQPLLRRLATRVTKRVLQSAMGVSAAKTVTAFRAFRTELRQAFAGYQGPMPNLDVLLSWGAAKFSSTAVRHNPRQTGTSGYTVRKLAVHTLNMVTGYTVRPLQLASLMGFALTLVGLCLLLFVLGRYMVSGTTVQGFPFLASIICLFSGAQLFALGIMGEYFARMHLRLMDKPVYTVAETVNCQKPAPRP
ncbi:undecaprenyl-phosphate 4-deoxy-4-formamido-L-arabinose transferase [Fundidesulfovibrio butyratiphilus]